MITHPGERSTLWKNLTENVVVRLVCAENCRHGKVHADSVGHLAFMIPYGISCFARPRIREDPREYKVWCSRYRITNFFLSLSPVALIP